MDDLAKIPGVILTKLPILPTSNGAVMKALKIGDLGFCGFGEAYYSTVDDGVVKGWKLHKDLTLNLTVPNGSITFALYYEKEAARYTAKVTLSPRSLYARLTVPPDIWLSFRGNEPDSLVMNIINGKHDPSETRERNLDHPDMPAAWAKNPTAVNL